VTPLAVKEANTENVEVIVPLVFVAMKEGALPIPEVAPGRYPD
jgi:hypothetical protein